MWISKNIIFRQPFPQGLQRKKRIRVDTNVFSIKKHFDDELSVNKSETHGLN